MNFKSSARNVMTTDAVLEARAMELPAYDRLRIRDWREGGWRYLTAREICLLQEVFEEVLEKHLKGSDFEELGQTLGVVDDAD